MLLILFSSLVASVIGWDGLGLTSFVLVLYYKNRRSLGRGFLVGLTNRVGDSVFMILLGLTAAHRGIHSHWQVCCLLILAMTKRAQVPFSA